MKQTKSYKVIAAMTVAVLALLWGMFFTCDTVFAETGTISSCTITRYYRHPVSWEIEDSGGEGSFATGQGMVEGCVNSVGLMEETEDGRCYLTIRMSLADFTSNISFKVQSWGASGWSSASASETGHGSDSQGATTDYRMEVPGKDCIVRGTMYVEPMGRDVIFYCAPGGYTEGNSGGFNAQIVTESPSEEKSPEVKQETEQEESVKEEPAEQKEVKKEKNSAVKDVEEAIDNIGKVTAKSEDKIKAAREAYNALSDKQKEKVKNYETLIKAEKKLSEIQTAEIEMPSTESTLKAAGGLTLSTAKADTEAGKKEGGNTGKTVGIILGVIVLAGAAGAGVYFVKKNREGKGDTRDDDE